MVYINGKQTFRTIFVLGILFGLTLLARIDFLVIALCLIFVLFIKKLLRLREAVIVVLLMLLISSPWFIYVHSVTGSFLTSSAEQTTSIFHLVFYKNKFINFFNSLLLYLTPFVYLGSKVFLSYMLSIAFILVIYYLYKVSRFEIKKLSNVSMIGHWFVSFFFILIIYLIFSDADYFYLRYFSILSVLALPLYNVFFVYLLNDKYKKLLPVAIAAVIIAFLVQAFLYFNSGKIVDHLAIRPGFIEKNISSNAIVASWQSGVTGYYCSSVYNLDGKMNYKCLEYSKRGKLEKYLDSLGVNVLIGWNEYIDRLEENNSNKIWKVYSKNIGDNHTGVYIRKGSESSVLKNYPKE